MDGYASAVFKWINNIGYEYHISCVDEGVFQIGYKEIEGTDKTNPIVTFTDDDADGLIKVMQEAVTFYRENKG